jgi:hypothetical protein
MWKKDSVSAERVPGAMAAYRESVDDFSKHATEFLEHIPTLAKAREAYQRALMVSTELRNILDTGDDHSRHRRVKTKPFQEEKRQKPKAEFR